MELQCDWIKKTGSLPQIFLPSVAAVDKASGDFVAFGSQALLPQIRAGSTLVHPLKPSNKISKVTYPSKLMLHSTYND